MGPRSSVSGWSWVWSLPGTQIFLFVPRSCNVNQFTFHITYLFIAFILYWCWKTLFKPGSQMPPTYLGQLPARSVNIYRQFTCPRHWPPACLRSWAEFNFTDKPAVVGDDNVDSIHIYVWNGWNCSNSIVFRAYSSTSAINRRCAGNPQEKIADLCQLQTATSRRDMRKRL